jgi:capsular exopolysaccharide synthesis family protein
VGSDRPGGTGIVRPTDYLRIVRRRWWVLLVTTVIAMSFAFVTRPSSAANIKASQPNVRYRATTTLISNPLGDGGATAGRDYDRLSLLVTTGEVPKRVVKVLDVVRWPGVQRDGIGGNCSSGASSASSASSAGGKSTGGSDCGSPKSGKRIRPGAAGVTLGFGGAITVTSTPDPTTGSLAITAVSGTAKGSAKVANLFATTLITYLNDLSQQKWDVQLYLNQQARSAAQAQLRTIDAQIAVAGLSPSELDALEITRETQLRKLANATDAIANLQQVGAAKTDLRTLEAADPKQVTIIVTSGRGVTSESQRMLFGAAIGFFIGLAILILIEVLSSRIRDVPGTEGAARMPVIAEIPVVRMERGEKFRVATMLDPSSLMSEAYRSLRTSLIAMWQRHPKNYRPATAEGEVPPPALRTLLVTSPGPAEGKSISAVNLAAAFAESGMSVLVIDADFRRPQLHKYFQGSPTPCVLDLAPNATAADCEAIVQESGIPNVRFIASAPTRTDPGHAIAAAKHAATLGKELVDIVIVDSPPILLANDAAELSTFVDATVVMARAGWTRRGGVVAAADLLRRLEATVVGVVLVGAEHGARAGYYGYYGYYGYGYGYAHPGETPKLQRMFPWRTPKPAPMVRPRPEDQQVPVGAYERADGGPEADLDLTSED